jgi:hypothetical protein
MGFVLGVIIGIAVALAAVTLLTKRIDVNITVMK